MEYATIGYAVRDGVAVIMLNRPDVMNALNTKMRAEITHAVQTAEKEARVVVLTGAGKAFCSGQDLTDGGSAAALDLEKTLQDEYVPMLRAISDCKIPTIAAVNGPAAGAGANLALAADVIIASQDAYFVQAFTRIGLIPDAGGTHFLPRQVGLARAMGAMLFADKISAEVAAEWGMIYEVVPAADFVSHYTARAVQLAQGPTVTYGYLKDALRATFDNTLDQQLALEAELQGKCGKTKDFMEGVMAFIEKRPTRFEGH